MERLRGIISATILTVAAVGQVVLWFFLYNHNGNEFIRNTGWVILWISAIPGVQGSILSPACGRSCGNIFECNAGRLLHEV
jgi:hypothetical protein